MGQNTFLSVKGYCSQYHTCANFPERVFRHDTRYVHGPWWGTVLACDHQTAAAAGQPNPLLEVLPRAAQAASRGT